MGMQRRKQTGVCLDQDVSELLIACRASTPSMPTNSASKPLKNLVSGETRVRVFYPTLLRHRYPGITVCILSSQSETSSRPASSAGWVLPNQKSRTPAKVTHPSKDLSKGTIDHVLGHGSRVADGELGVVHHFSGLFE